MIEHKTILDILGTYTNILYTRISNSELPIYTKVKFIEIMSESRDELIASWLEKREES